MQDHVVRSAFTAQVPTNLDDFAAQMMVTGPRRIVVGLLNSSCTVECRSAIPDRFFIDYNHAIIDIF